jgi:transcriptional regulator with XRE-family HTH domain
MNIGDKIKEQRLKNGLTQEQLAQLLNVSRPTISSWEVGRNYPDLETIIAISDLFGISLDKLLREDKEMAKDAVKKGKRGKLYKYLLIGVTCCFALYVGFNLKLRYDERTYRENLSQHNWKLSTDAMASGNGYELTENGIQYSTYILPAGWTGIPLVEQKLSIITNKEDFFVQIDHDDSIRVGISPKNDSTFKKRIYVTTDKNGKLLEENPAWSKKYRENIVNYLQKYQTVHVELINASYEKLKDIAGK